MKVDGLAYRLAYRLRHKYPLYVAKGKGIHVLSNSGLEITISGGKHMEQEDMADFIVAAMGYFIKKKTDEESGCETVPCSDCDEDIE